MKLDYTIGRIFQERSLSELETLHPLCELERTQIVQFFAFCSTKNLAQDICYQATGLTSSIRKKTSFGITLALNWFHNFVFLMTKDASNANLYFIKTKFFL